MTAAAAEYFAEHGLDASTRDIAKALDVKQALIYKHFSSKEDLIEQTLARAFAVDPVDAPWLDLEQGLEAGLLRYYTHLASKSNELRMRLFIRAGLDGRTWPARRGTALTQNLFLPIIEALRRDAGLPDLARTAAMRGERELVMMLHASVVFLGIRRHIYQTPMPDDVGDVVALLVTTFVASAVPAIRRLHENGQKSLREPLAPQT